VIDFGAMMYVPRNIDEESSKMIYDWESTIGMLIFKQEQVAIMRREKTLRVTNTLS
jgi:hypothetical protein